MLRCLAVGWHSRTRPHLAARRRHTLLPPHALIPIPVAAQVPESLRQRRGEVVAKLKSLEGAVKPITDFLSNEENVKLLKQDKTQNMTFLQKEFNIGACAPPWAGL